MTIREILSKKNIEEKKLKSPSWVEKTPTTKILFDAALFEFNRISNILESGKQPGDKKLKIVLSEVAKRAQLDRSNLSQRRQPEICFWIQERNKELASMVLKKNPGKVRSKGKSKKEIQAEFNDLKKSMASRYESEYRSFVEMIFSSNLLDDRDKLARENNTLKIKLHKLEEQAARLKYENMELSKHIVEVVSHLSPEQRISLKFAPRPV